MRHEHRNVFNIDILMYLHVCTIPTVLWLLYINTRLSAKGIIRPSVSNEHVPLLISQRAPEAKRTHGKRRRRTGVFYAQDVYLCLKKMFHRIVRGALFQNVRDLIKGDL